MTKPELLHRRFEDVGHHRSDSGFRLVADARGERRDYS
jgi:hypothetical protein